MKAGKKAGGVVAKVSFNLRTWGERFFQAVVQGGCLSPDLQHSAPGSSPSPPAVAHSQAGRAPL